MSSLPSHEDLHRNKLTVRGDDSSSVDAEGMSSEVSSTTPAMEESNSSSDHDDPELLVGRENQIILATRVIVVLLLLGTALGVSSFIFVFATSNEEDAFESDYQAVAKTILDSFKTDITLKFFAAKTLAAVVSAAYEKDIEKSEAVTEALAEHGVTSVQEAAPWKVSVPKEQFLQATSNAKWIINSHYVGYSPLLFQESHREEFEAFALNYQSQHGPFFEVDQSSLPDDVNKGALAWNYSDGIFVLDPASGEVSSAPTLNGSILNASVVPSFYSPLWQADARSVQISPTLYDQASDEIRSKALQRMMDRREPVLSETYLRNTTYYDVFYGEKEATPGVYLYYPVHQLDPETGKGMKIIGSIVLELVWESFLTSIYPPNSENVNVVIENSCGQIYTYVVDVTNHIGDYKEHAMVLVGEGDLHDANFDEWAQSTEYSYYSDIVWFSKTETLDEGESSLEACMYRFVVYPTQAMESQYITNDPVVYAVTTFAVFLFVSGVLFLYDWIVRNRQKKIMTVAKRTNDIVTGLFPKSIRDRLYNQVQADAKHTDGQAMCDSSTGTSRSRMHSFLQVENATGFLFDSEPIADYFPMATVCVINIANFSAWSSERGPEQVLILLEQLFYTFDSIGKRMGVMKIESIADQYIAVTGLPTQRQDHAELAVRFAYRCLKAMMQITRKLEVCLGPDTGDLKARVGIHSGPVTAGVLRGEKARFQLFGNVTNVAARVEAAGHPMRIQVTNETAELLVERGRSSWLCPRSQLVELKGRGEVQLYWAKPATNKEGSTTSSVGYDNIIEQHDGEDDKLRESMDKEDRLRRLIDWNHQVLYTLLEKVVAARGRSPVDGAELQKFEATLENERNDGTLVIDEFTEIISIPKFNPERVVMSSGNIISDPIVKAQLREYISAVAQTYREVPFHNFEHASHVILSTGKMMKRIVEPDDVNYEIEGMDTKTKAIAIARQIHDSTYGISSDALLQFTSVFAALIHDADHTGLTNKELVELGVPLARTYRETSVAEQNSVDLCWHMLMDEKYRALRRCVYSTPAEMKRFRELLVNAVMATDIADKRLQTLRKNRWSDAFAETTPPTNQISKVDAENLDANRKATIVYEHLIQASDVSHTMQHWITFRKYNARLFEERYVAWLKGVAGEEDPSVGWYKGEIGFFDYYLIPLAKKLHQCGVFGVSYHEYLHHAQENRREWEKKGEKITAEMLAYCQQKYPKGLESIVDQEDCPAQLGANPQTEMFTDEVIVDV